MATRKKKSTQPVTDQPTHTQTTQSPFTTGMLVIHPPTQEEITKSLEAAKAAVAEIHAKAEAVTITDLATYRQADTILADIRNGEQVIEDKMNPVIKLLREPLDTLYEWRRGIAQPLEEDKILVKSKMGGWQLKEKQRLDAEEAERQKKAKALQDEWLAKNQPEPPPPMTFPPQPADLGAAPGTVAFPYTWPPCPVCQASHDPRVHFGTSTVVPQVTYLSPPTAPAPTAAHSSARFERRVRTTDLDLLVDACIAGLPGVTEGQSLDMLTIKPSVLQGWFVSNPDVVATWPGVEVYDHPIITGK